MNPFILLAKPLIAAGLFVTKMFVAVGYLVTQGHGPATKPEPIVEQVRVSVVPSPSGLESMELEMPNGELFQLSSAEAVPSAEGRSSGTATRPYFRREHPDEHLNVIATLESTLGRTMRCDVSVPQDSERGSAHCTVPTDETYDLVF